MTQPKLILASGSAIRARLLENAGLAFTVEKPAVDEAALKRAHAGDDLESLALRLAEAKARAVDAAGAFVLGADQILEFEGRAFDKAATLAEARARLLKMQGREHSLINASAIARDGRIVFRHIERPRLFMRALNEAEIDAYFEKAGASVLQSVGAYQLESLGAGLFERIDGDCFAVLGLSLFPVLGFLKMQGLGPF